MDGSPAAAKTTWVSLADSPEEFNPIADPSVVSPAVLNQVPDNKVPDNPAADNLAAANPATAVAKWAIPAESAEILRVVPEACPRAVKTKATRDRHFNLSKRLRAIPLPPSERKPRRRSVRTNAAGRAIPKEALQATRAIPRVAPRVTRAIKVSAVVASAARNAVATGAPTKSAATSS